MTGGTLTAARLVMKPEPLAAPIAFHIGGGFHHAFANHGEGFCVFNDVAVAIRWLFESGAVRRAAVIDLDVHHGNGTAFIFEREPRVFTFSMHQQHNYPMHKPRGSLDIGLADGTTDETYLAALERALPKVFSSSPRDRVLSRRRRSVRGRRARWAGADQGGTARARSTRAPACRSARSTPAVVVLAGGYARQVDDTVDIHYGDLRRSVRCCPSGASAR